MIDTIKKNKTLYFSWMVAVLCITLSVLTNSVLVLAAFLIFTVVAFFAPTADMLALLIALMPMANIFKLAPGQTSLFTVCEILAVVVMVMKKKKISAWLFLSMAMLAMYMLATSIMNFDILLIIKILVGFLIIDYSKAELSKKDVRNIVILFSVSIIITLILSMNLQYFEHIIPYFDDLDYYYSVSGNVSNGGMVFRVSGFIGDPNYCSIFIITALSLLCVLYYYKNIGYEFWVIVAILLPLGFFTYSKSYFLTVITLILFLIFFILFPKNKKLALCALVLLVLVTVLALSGKIGVVNLILERFMSGDITTGRTELNVAYLQYIFSDLNVLLFGEGIASDRFVGAENNVHNIYIELIYKMGILGGALIVICLVIAMSNSDKKVVPKKLINYIPLLFLMVMYFFLAGVTSYALPIYLILAYVAMNYSCLYEEKKNDGIIRVR